MAQTLDSFITNFNGGFRTNRFFMSMTNTTGKVPGLVGSNGAPGFHIRSATIPTVTTNPIEVPYRGRIYKLPGQRIFNTWQITVLDDTNNLWKQFMDWNDFIMGNSTNVMASGANDKTFDTLMEDITVKQLTFNGADAKTVVLKKAWPSEIGEIRLSQDDQESLATFTVNLEYQYIDSYS